MIRGTCLERKSPIRRRVLLFLFLIVGALLFVSARNQDSAPSLEGELAPVLSRSPLPAALTLHTGVLRLKPGQDRIAHRIILEVPVADLTRGTKEKDGSTAVECAFFARLLDAEGNVCAKFGRVVPRAAGAPESASPPVNVSLAHEVALAAGSYTLEAVAEDRLAGKYAARKLNFEVSAPGDGVSLSSLVLLSRTEPVALGRLNPSDSLQFHGRRIVPNLSGQVAKHKGGEVRFYLVIFPRPAVPYEPQLGIEFSRGGKIVGAVQPKLPDRNDQGNIAFIIEFSTAQFKAGEYVARAVVRQGDAVAETSTAFDVIPESRK